MFQSSLIFIFALAAMVTAQNGCQGGKKPACCDVVFATADSQELGLNCDLGGIDCAFGFQVHACCTSITPITKVGHGCTK
ncbi:hypothetical protein C8J57DRAFT_223020 [Mycena rebaudengoi]|nr:hypothetical protein C8J57DRAFT_223020 [Mycena rebaudengoi]